MEIEDTFGVAATVDETWSLLNDVPAVIPCMPGAELVETKGDDEWLARLATKVGPMALKFDAEVVRTRSDESGHIVELQVQARELKGRGNAKAKISSTLTDKGGGQGTDVAVVMDILMQGRLAQFGRGVIAEISAQMTRQFAASLADRLQQTGPGSTPPTGEGDPSAHPEGPRPAEAKPVPALRLLAVAIWNWFKKLFSRRKRG